MTTEFPESIETLLSKLAKIQLNLKKAPNRTYLRCTIIKKINNIKKIYSEINQELQKNENSINTQELEFLIKATRLEYNAIYDILQFKLKNARKTLSFKSCVLVIIFINQVNSKKKMANPQVFDIKTATAIVQQYDGTADNLDAFVDAANLLKDYVTAEQIPMAVKFLKTRLTGKARIGLPENLVTIDAMVNDVKARCSERISPENILAKLKNTKQKGDTNTICDEVDALSNKLKSIYLGQGIPEEVAKSMATKAGVEALINGVNNFETKLILKAGTFTNIKDALQKVQENTASVQTPTQIMSFNAQRQNNNDRHYRGRRTGTGNHTSNNHNRFNNYRSNNNGNNYNNNRYSTNNRFQARFPNRNNISGNYTRGGRRDNRSRQVYMTNVENPQPMGTNMPNGGYLIPPLQRDPSQLTVPAGTPQQNLNFLGQTNQGQYPARQFIQ